jgi:peroxiredoxin family protein
MQKELRASFSSLDEYQKKYVIGIINALAYAKQKEMLTHLTYETKERLKKSKQKSILDEIRR